MAEGDKEVRSPSVNYAFGDATVDDKGRILIGKSIRQMLGDTFVIVFGELGNLEAYPLESWHELTSIANRFSPSNPYIRDYEREKFAMSDTECKFDQQGRVVIPRELRDLAKIGEKVRIVAFQKHVEIWDEREFEAYKKDRRNYNLGRRMEIVESLRLAQEYEREMKSLFGADYGVN